MRRLSIWIGGGVAALIAVGVICYGVGHARAYGVPTVGTGTLTFTGTLLTFGQPDNSTHQISVALWPSGASSPSCTTGPSAIAVTNGQFSVALSPGCVGVVHQDPNVQAQVTVDSTPMGLTPLTAVPYALEAASVSGSPLLSNVGVSASVASNALTINLTQNDGASTPTAGNPAIIGFRSSTATLSAAAPQQVSAALFITVPAGASLGQLSGNAEHTYVYAQNAPSGVQLCVSTSGLLDEGSSQTSTAIGSTSTSRTALYCTEGATGPVRLIARLLNTETPAGTWALPPTEAAAPPFFNPTIANASPSRIDIEYGAFSGAGGLFAPGCNSGSAAGNCNTSPCLLTGASPGVTSVARNAAGTYQLNFAAGTFSGPPSCTFSVYSCQDDDASSGGPGGPSTATTFNFNTIEVNSGGVPVDSQGYFNCFGPH